MTSSRSISYDALFVQISYDEILTPPHLTILRRRPNYIHPFALHLKLFPTPPSSESVI